MAKKKRSKVGKVLLTQGQYESIRKKASAGYQAAKRGIVHVGRRSYEFVRSDAGHKSGIVPVAAAALTAMMAGWDEIKKRQFIKDNWWFLPLMLMLVGWVVRYWALKHGRSRLAEAGTTLLVTGVVLMWQAYKNQPKKQEQPFSQQPGEQASGPEEGGAGRHWIRTADNQYVSAPAALTEGSRFDAAATMANSLYEEPIRS